MHSMERRKSAITSGSKRLSSSPALALILLLGLFLLGSVSACSRNDASGDGATGVLPLTSLAVRPPEGRLAVGGSMRLRAIATFADNSMADVTGDVEWSSEAPAVASVGNEGDSKGELEAFSKGSVAIIASYGGVTGRLQLDVIGSIPAESGPLKVNLANPRYFSRGTVKAILLTGSHTWLDFQDAGHGNPPPSFDYPGFLDFLEENGHNFFRLWTWEQTRWTLETSDDLYWFGPSTPFARTGPGDALDGLPRFDLETFDQAYFDRLRARVEEAGERGIYVAVMLFDGWSVAKEKGNFSENNPWRGHPFNAANNINGVDGDVDGDDSGEETHELANAEVLAIQEAYVRKVIDTVNDLDNVLYEISNESHSNSQDWQYHMIDFIKDYERTLVKQHPVGMTVEYPGGDNAELFASPADWISVNGSIDNPPAADGTKVILDDTDHLCGICGDREWVWKSFMRGRNPVFMDGYDGAAYGVGGEGFDFDAPTWVSLRANLGYVQAFADRVNLVAMEPRGDLASTGYCLSSVGSGGSEYLVYAPDGGGISVDLSSVSGDLTVEWFDPSTGNPQLGGSVPGGGWETFSPPFAGDAVLYLH